MDEAPVVYQFFQFRLDPERRHLHRDGQPVTLPPRLMDALLLLVGNRDRLLTKEEFFDRLWPDTIVDENNLSQTISALRKVLGDGNGTRFIDTVPKRGYRFIAPVAEIRSTGTPAPVPSNRRSWTLAALASIVLVIVSAGMYWSRAHAATPQQMHSLAVLPLKPIGPTGGRDYLGLGLADGLITRLGYIRQLAVRPTSAVRPYGAPTADPLEAGRALAVDGVLDGTYQVSGSRLRVNLRLLAVPTGSQMWADTFDVASADTLTIEDAVGDAVAANLRREFIEPKSLLARRGTSDPDAYEAYIRGRYHWSKRTPDDMKLALELFRHSIDRDPQNALAWSGLADAYSLATGFHLLPAADAYPRAEDAARQALRLDPSMSQPHATLGYVQLYYLWNWEAAHRELQRAVELDPNNAVAHQWLSNYFMVVGRDTDALAEIERARELDPLSLMINTVKGTHLLYARRYDEAIAQLQHTLTLDPKFAAAHLVLGLTYEQKKMYPQSLSELQIARDASQGAPYAQAYLAQAEALTGDRTTATRTVGSLLAFADRDKLWPFGLTRVYASLGRLDDAFASIDRSYDERVPEIIYVKRDPTLDSLRNDSRYGALLRKMQLE